jgi:hypothetical protein
VLEQRPPLLQQVLELRLAVAVGAGEQDVVMRLFQGRDRVDLHEAEAIDQGVEAVAGQRSGRRLRERVALQEQAAQVLVAQPVGHGRRFRFHAMLSEQVGLGRPVRGG